MAVASSGGISTSSEYYHEYHHYRSTHTFAPSFLSPCISTCMVLLLIQPADGLVRVVEEDMLRSEEEGIGYRKGRRGTAGRGSRL